MSIFDGLPIPKDKSFLKEELSRIDESWAAARFDSLPHVVHILTSKDREGEVKVLKEQSDIIEEVVDEVVHAYHSGFNKAIQNYSQILRLFSESAQSLGELKVDLAQAKKLLGAHNKQLHQLWYRSVTLRHIISLLDQVEGIAKVPARIEKLIAEKQFYAAVQLHVHSSLMLEREGLQAVGALQDVRSELTKLRGAFFYKVLEDLHSHLYNKGEYSSDVSSMLESDDAIPTATATSSMNYSHSLSRRTRLLKGDGDGVYRPSSVDGSSSFDGHNEDGNLDLLDDAAPNGYTPTMKANGGDARMFSRQIPVWLSDSTPDEFVEAMRKSDAPVHVKYLQTMVECLSMLGKVSAAGAIICQRLRSTIHDIITAKIKAQVGRVSGQRNGLGHTASPTVTGLHYLKGQLEHHLAKQKRQNGITPNGALAVSPVSHVMSPSGTAQISARDLLDSILETVVRIFENHVIVGELLESKSSQQLNMNTPKTMATDVSWSNDSDVSNDTGGFSVGFSLNVLQSECQQLIREILRATPEATSADAAVQTARLASKNPSKDKRDGSEDGLTFAFRFTDASTSAPNQGSDLNRQGWRRPNVVQEGYGTGAVLPEQGIYLAASVYRPVVQFTEKVASLLPQKFSQLGNDGLLAFTENFVKDHFLPTMFVDYRKSVQQAISSPAAFRPRANVAVSYTPSIGKGRPVLQGLLAIDCLAKEVLGWAQAMPKFAGDLINYVQTFLERTYERCRTSYMEAVLEKQSYMLIGRHDVYNLLRLDPSSTCLPNSLDDGTLETNDLDAGSNGVEMELSDILLNLRPIKQENLIREDNKLILLASLSDSLEYVADSIERLGKSSSKAYNHVEENEPHHARTSSLPPKDLESFAEDYRKLAIDCLKVLRIEMQLETIFHLQEMTKREYLDDQDAEEPDDFVISLTSQITRRDEEIAPFVADVKRNYIFGGICPIAANWSIKALAEMKSINLFGVQQICRNSIALEQALAAVSSIDSEVVQMRLDRVRTYYELLNMPFEALLAFIQEHEDLFSAAEYLNLLKVFVPGREIPEDAQDRLAQILPS
ncbi:exocyst complex component SEC8-like [Salvia splendens]|uniref:exocyst complex component SEC8-like n=1 Tax=Salvia splendens TaxID=180675 RepID=UPI001C259531|nr:exocyst complex component SEC8-like [Salvia splendens]XP_042035949.1 exocyst complex component SEC8-like [Salvia splendens]XP_042035950.1 exocyst complex component SEC8-like [Salvia splendens]XP_042035951.1 exocyst complex component SEC8-like [Salvia splendens]